MKMRFKYRFKSTLQFIAFAFYPKTTLIACSVFSAMVIAVLGIAMSVITESSTCYNIVFALTTGAAASFFVSFIVELMNNYRHNNFTWYELHDYYSAVTNYENKKQVLMRHYPVQRAVKKAHDEFIAAGGEDDFDDQPMDLIQATWKQLPKIIPVFRKTLDEKKGYLSDTEIDELQNIMTDFSYIREEVKMLIMKSSLLHNVLNHPDEEILGNYYPKNILADMPEWMRKQIASRESEIAMERLIDTILSDDFLLAEVMEDYDISKHGLESYQNTYDDKKYETMEFDEEEYDFSEPEDEEEFKALHEAQDRELIEEHRPFVSFIISKSCSNIAESIDILEQSIIKKPYYGISLEFERNAEKASMDDPIIKIRYESEKERLEKLLKKKEEE